jgi:hypothetical protein
VILDPNVSINLPGIAPDPSGDPDNTESSSMSSSGPRYKSSKGYPVNR